MRCAMLALLNNRIVYRLLVLFVRHTGKLWVMDGIFPDHGSNILHRRRFAFAPFR